MKVVFMGTPDFSVPVLKGLMESEEHEVTAVVTQPDKARGRSGRLVFTPVKEVAVEAGIPVYTPQRVRSQEFIEQLKTIPCDVIVVIAFGQILPKEVLEYPRYGCINVHASLLPKYRGAAPIQRAILAGEKEAGVTIMKMAEGIDTGDMYKKASFPLSGTENYGEIHDRLAALGAELITDVMEQIFRGVAHAEKQDDALATYAAKIEKEDRLLSFDAPAEEIINKIRAFSPAPGAEAALPSGKVKITAAKCAGDAPDGAPGTVSVLSAKGDGTLAVNCKDGKILIERLIPEGKKEMTAGDFIRGRRITPEDKFL